MLFYVSFSPKYIHLKIDKSFRIIDRDGNLDWFGQWIYIYIYNIY